MNISNASKEKRLRMVPQPIVAKLKAVAGRASLKAGS
jgi:hypothetical protein